MRLTEIQKLVGKSVEQPDGTVSRVEGDFGSVWSIDFPCRRDYDQNVNQCFYALKHFFECQGIHNRWRDWYNAGMIPENLPQDGWFSNQYEYCSNDLSHPIFLIGKYELLIPEIEKIIKKWNSAMAEVKAYEPEKKAGKKLKTLAEMMAADPYELVFRPPVGPPDGPPPDENHVEDDEENMDHLIECEMCHDVYDEEDVIYNDEHEGHLCHTCNEAHHEQIAQLQAADAEEG